MASLINEGKGKRRIEWGPRGSRERIRLGKMSERNAQVIRHQVEEILAAKSSGCVLSPTTLEWLERIDDALTEKLAEKGLIEPRARGTLGPFLDAYIQKRQADLKPLTLKNLHTSRDYLVDFFGAAKPLQQITEGDTNDWRLALLAGELGDTKKRRKRSENTVRMRTSTHISPSRSLRSGIHYKTNVLVAV